MTFLGSCTLRFGYPFSHLKQFLQFFQIPTSRSSESLLAIPIKSFSRIYWLSFAEGLCSISLNIESHVSPARSISGHQRSVRETRPNTGASITCDGFLCPWQYGTVIWRERVFLSAQTMHDSRLFTSFSSELNHATYGHQSCLTKGSI